MKPISWPEVCDTSNLNMSQLSDKVKGWIADYKRDEKNAETKRADKKGKIFFEFFFTKNSSSLLETGNYKAASRSHQD